MTDPSTRPGIIRPLTEDDRAASILLSLRQSEAILSSQQVRQHPESGLERRSSSQSVASSDCSASASNPGSSESDRPGIREGSPSRSGDDSRSEYNEISGAGTDVDMDAISVQSNAHLPSPYTGGKTLSRSFPQEWLEWHSNPPGSRYERIERGQSIGKELRDTWPLPLPYERKWPFMLRQFKRGLRSPDEEVALQNEYNQWWQNEPTFHGVQVDNTEINRSRCRLNTYLAQRQRGPVIDIGGLGKHPEVRQFEAPRLWDGTTVISRSKIYDQARAIAPADPRPLPYETEKRYIARMKIHYPLKDEQTVKHEFGRR